MEENKTHKHLASLKFKVMSKDEIPTHKEVSEALLDFLKYMVDNPNEFDITADGFDFEDRPEDNASK